MARTPRLDPYQRLLSRFFETVFLLDALGGDAGSRTTVEHDPASQAATRRRFLGNLAFICDYGAGGSTKTAIAVEERPGYASARLQDCFTLWIASNEQRGVNIARFLTEVLGMVRRAVTPPANADEAEEAIARRCVESSASKIQDEAERLSRAAGKCKGYISGNLLPERDLGQWLTWIHGDGQPRSLFPLCRLAYDLSRNAGQMRVIEQYAQDPTDGSNVSHVANEFRHLKHCIERLAEQTMVPKQLIEDGRRLTDLLDAYQVRRVPPPTPVPPPEADGHTTLEGILGRMLSKDDERYRELHARLMALDRARNLTSKLLGWYDDTGASTLSVHAEIQLHEHFHNNAIAFAHGDRFIACSRPACLCCKLYLRHHPLRCAELGSHHHVDVDWSPPPIRDTRREADEFRGQRKILSSMIGDLREVVLDKIMDSAAARAPESDTTAGFTQSDSMAGFTPSAGGGDWLESFEGSLGSENGSWDSGEGSSARVANVSSPAMCPAEEAISIARGGSGRGKGDDESRAESDDNDSDSDGGAGV